MPSIQEIRTQVEADGVDWNDFVQQNQSELLIAFLGGSNTDLVNATGEFFPTVNSPNVSAASASIAAPPDLTNLGSYTYFPIWAEESGALNAGATEFSFGNGDETPANSGIVMAIDAELFAVAIEGEGGSNLSAGALQNGTLVAQNLPVSSSGFTLLGSPVQYLAGDVFNLMTVSATGALSGRSVGWFRIPTIGPEGPQGPAGADGDITWQGTWAAGTYTANQAVQFGGRSYVANATTTETPGLLATDWDLLADKGDAGPAGGGTQLSQLTGNIAGVSFDDVENDLSWTATTIANSTASVSGADITIADSGVYKFTVTLRTSSNNRSELFIRTYVNNVQDAAAQVSDYVSRDTDQNTGAVTLIYAFDLTAGDVVRFAGFGDTDGTCVGLNDGTVLIIEQL